MRLLFAGSPGIAVPTLRELFSFVDENADFELAGVLTNPDSPKGRSQTPLPTEIGELAESLSVARNETGKAQFAILKPEKLDAGFREQAAALKPDFLVSFAYGRIFGPKFLALFPLGGINIHPSLLPKYRGPTPIPAAILARDAETGISIQRLAPEMDSGDILLQERVTLNGRETTASLSELMAQKAAELLPAVLRGLRAGTIYALPQNNERASYCSLITKEDGRIDWGGNAAEIDAKIRAFDPWPLCWTMHGDKQLFILKANVFQNAAPALADTGLQAEPGLVLGIDKQQGILVQTSGGILAVTELQYQTKKALPWRDFLNGARNFIGQKLASSC
jgi:methionyl-tRNA formyltransferase